MYQVMVFRRRNQSIRPVHRIKHVIDNQQALGVNITGNVNLIRGVDAPTLLNTEEVETGSKVNAIYLVVECNATSSGALPNFYMAVRKNESNLLGVIAPNQVGANNAKRFYIHQEMVMFQQQTNSNPRTLFKGVIVIPKGFRRFAVDDFLQVQFLAPGITTQVCVQCHYKEFR